MKNRVIKITGTFKKASQSSLIEKDFITNKEYFSAENKRFFNVLKTNCFISGLNTVALIHEVQGQFFFERENNRNVVKIAYKSKVITLSGDWDGKGEKILFNIKELFKNGIGWDEGQIITNLKEITLSDDNILTFSKDGNTKKDSFDYDILSGEILTKKGA